MKKIRVHLKANSYDILIGPGVLSAAGQAIAKLKLGDSAYIITNSFLKNKYGKILNSSLNKYGISTLFHAIPDSEKSKSLKQASSIIAGLSRYGVKRKIFIVSLGGGVVGDISGFVASIYKRGIPYIQIPTTLLAQVDSSIGGKTAVDLQEGKNLIGAFYQPRLVLSDCRVLKSLPLRQIKSGLAEVIKYGAIKDRGLFLYLEKNHSRILKKGINFFEFIVTRCSRIKASVVEKDEKENLGLRTILNFGHTIGHAIEAASGYCGYNHGEAIALGMLIASGIGNKMGLTQHSACVRLEMLIKRIGLPTKINLPGLSVKSIIKTHYLDKKFTGRKNRFVLIKDIGKVTTVENIPLAVIEESIKERIQV